MDRLSREWVQGPAADAATVHEGAPWELLRLREAKKSGVKESRKC